MVWWAALHLLLAGALIMSAQRAPALWLLLPALCLHAWWWWPQPVTAALDCSHAGDWSLPAEGLHGLVLGPGTRYSAWWVELHFETPGGRRKLLLLRDQLDAGSWRVLQARLRETER